jgi:hypothetical protein
MTPVLARRSEDVVVRLIAGERFIIPIRGHVADLRGLYALNEVGWFVWDRVDGTIDDAGIASAVASAFEVSPETARGDVRALLGKLHGAGCIEYVA